MENITIHLYTNLNNVEETCKMNAIIDKNIIKYSDLENNKIVLDMDNDIMIRENSDYRFNLDFINDIISINIKEHNKTFIKKIETIFIKKTKKKYYVKYKLIDENVVNEYHIKF